MMDCRNPDRDPRRGDRVVARPETDAEAAGREAARRREEDSHETAVADVSLAVALSRGRRADRAVRRAGDRVRFDVDPLKFPANIHLGEAAGVATNSKGDVFVYTRTGHPTMSIGTARPFAHGGSRLFQFDRTGKFVREIGQDSYGFQVAQQVRVDPQDNVWVVDQMSSMVIKFDPNGQVQMLLGRKSESERVPALPPTPPAAPAAAAGEGRGGAGGGPQRRRPRAALPLTPRRRRDAAAAGLRARARRATCSTGRPTSRGTRPATSTSPTATATPGSRSSTRTASSSGRGDRRGLQPGQFNTPHGIAIDAQGLVYVADRATGASRSSTATATSRRSS